LNKEALFRSIVQHGRRISKHLHTLDISQYEANDLDERHKTSNKQTILNTVNSNDTMAKLPLFLSCLAHLIVILLFIFTYKHGAQPVQNHAPPSKPVTSMSVTSYLILRPVLSEPIASDSSPSELTGPEIPIPETQTLEPEPIELEPIELAPLETVQTKTQNPEPAREILNEMQIEQVNPLESSKQIEAEVAPLMDSIMLNGTSSQQSMPTEPFSSSALRRYQSKQNTQAINRMAQEQARTYREEKTSPKIEPPTLPSQEEREATLRKREVDCSNVAKKALRMATAFTGGTIECRKHADIQQFIDKHINTGVEDDEQ